MSILLFGGTSEGRLLALWCGARKLPVTLCVATEYGAALAPEAPGVTVKTGRLTRPEMEQMLATGAYTRVVDATHPYAAEVTQNLRAAAEGAAVPYLRLVRDGEEAGDWLSAGDPLAAADLLETLPGNVLLTTGSKDLAIFAREPLRGRCFPRVLPSLESLARCLELGFAPGHILCMQGPFSAALNEAIIRQYDVKTLVTKATGRAGGFWEKAAAARAVGCALLVIDRPVAETGLTLDEIKKALKGERTE